MQKIKNGEKKWSSERVRFYSYSLHKRFYTRLNFNYDPNGLRGVWTWNLLVLHWRNYIVRNVRQSPFCGSGILSATEYSAFGKINTFVLRTPYGYTFFDCRLYLQWKMCRQREIYKLMYVVSKHVQATGTVSFSSNFSNLDPPMIILQYSFICENKNRNQQPSLNLIELWLV